MHGVVVCVLRRKMQYLEFAADFRTVRYYNNIMYGLAEHVLETIDGRSWQDIVRENIYEVGALTTICQVHVPYMYMKSDTSVEENFPCFYSKFQAI